MTSSAPARLVPTEPALALPATTEAPDALPVAAGGAALLDRPVSALDAWLSEDDGLRLPPAEAAGRRVHHLREAVELHLGSNPAYARYADSLGFEPGCLRTEGDLARIPVLPSGVFKREQHLVRSGSSADVVLTTSSGTQGSVSRVPRDDTTMRRFFASVAAGVRDLLELEHSETFVHNLGPTVQESQHLWISYVMSGVSLMHDTAFHVRDGRLDLEGVTTALREHPTTSPGAPLIVVGPPPLVLDLARHLERTQPLPGHPDHQVVTIGGWKRRSGETLARPEFDAAVVQAFGLAGPHAVRDAFNMVELNSVVLECAEHRKHLPPWLHAVARDPRTLAPLPPGRVGVLSYADPTPTSYPGMVLSDDFGAVHREVACPCGTAGDVLAVDRRISRMESRGCALKI